MKARRRKPSAASRVRPFWMMLSFCTVIVFAAIAFAATYPGFDPRRIVVTGNSRVSRADILARAAIAAHTSIWVQNTAAMAQRIDAIPYVASVRVRRIPPATLRIHVTEREPFAVLRSGGDDVLVDRALRVLGPANDASILPVVVVEPGIDLSPGAFVQTPAAIELRDASTTLAASKLFPAELSFDRFGGLVVTLRGGLRLLLGNQSDLAQKIRLTNAILAQVVTRRGRVAAIDVRAPSAPVLVYR